MPLHMTVRRGSAKVVYLLLQHGADCNAKVTLRGAQSMTPLAHAVIGDHKSVADMLLSKCAGLVAMDDQQRSPLHLAVLDCQECFSRKLVRCLGADRGLLDKCELEGRTALAHRYRHGS